MREVLGGPPIPSSHRATLLSLTYELGSQIRLCVQSGFSNQDKALQL